MMRVKLEKKIDGYEEWAEYRESKEGDKYYYMGNVYHTPLEVAGLHRLILTPEKPKRWRAKEDGEYWFVCQALLVREIAEERDSFDDNLYELGNYFQTKEEAEAYRNHCKSYFTS